MYVKMLECKFKRSWPPFQGNKVLLRESVADGSTNRQERSFAWIGIWFIKTQKWRQISAFQETVRWLIRPYPPTLASWFRMNGGKTRTLIPHPLFLLSWVEKNTQGKWSSSFADKLHDALSIDEPSLSSVALYTIVINNNQKERK